MWYVFVEKQSNIPDLSSNTLQYLNTEDPRYNDSVCYQRFCCKIESAVIKKLDMNPSEAWITGIF